MDVNARKVKLIFSHEEEIGLKSMYDLFYGLETVNSLANAITDITNNQLKKVYYKRDFERWLRERDYRLLYGEEIQALRIVKESPLVMDIMLSSIAAIYTLTKVVELIYTMKTSKVKLKKEVEALENEAKISALEIERRRLELEKLSIELESMIEERQRQKLNRALTEAVIKKVASSMENSGLQLEQLEIAGVELSLNLEEGKIS